MVDEISDELWASLRTLLPELVDEDRGRIDKSVQSYRSKLDYYGLSPSTKKEVRTVKSQAANLRQRIVRLYGRPEFLQAGVDDKSPGPKPDGLKQIAAAMDLLASELVDAEARFKRLPKARVSTVRNSALETLVSQMLYLICEKKSANPPVSWSETSNGLRFQKFIRLVRGSRIEWAGQSAKTGSVGRRATKAAHGYGEDWGELVGPDI